MPRGTLALCAVLATAGLAHANGVSEPYLYEFFGEVTSGTVPGLSMGDEVNIVIEIDPSIAPNNTQPLPGGGTNAQFDAPTLISASLGSLSFDGSNGGSQSVSDQAMNIQDSYTLSMTDLIGDVLPGTISSRLFLQLRGQDLLAAGAQLPDADELDLIVQSDSNTASGNINFFLPVRGDSEGEFVTNYVITGGRIVPAPGAAGVLALGAVFGLRRRR